MTRLRLQVSALQNAASVASMVLYNRKSCNTTFLNRQFLTLRWIQVWESINLNNIKHRLQNAVCVLHYVLTKLIYSYNNKNRKRQTSSGYANNVIILYNTVLPEALLCFYGKNYHYSVNYQNCK